MLQKTFNSYIQAKNYIAKLRDQLLLCLDKLVKNYFKNKAIAVHLHFNS